MGRFKITAFPVNVLCFHETCSGINGVEIKALGGTENGLEGGSVKGQLSGKLPLFFKFSMVS